jgi:AhpD family alkylhydroperoxidase
MSQLRLPYCELSSQAMRGFLQAHAALESGPLDKSLLEWVNLRVSQINGCAYCLEMHAHLLREAGESNRRLDALAGWRCSELFDARERAALAWAESLTDIVRSGAPDADFAALGEHFSAQEISDLTLAVGLINAFNRIAIGMRR